MKFATEVHLKHTTIGPMIPKEMKYNLHYGEKFYLRHTANIYIKKKRSMDHNSLTCIFANAMQSSSSIVIAIGTQILQCHKKVKG